MITRRIAPALQKCQRQLGSRNIHSTPRWNASARYSPAVRKKRNAQHSPGGAPGPKQQNFNVDEALPPITMLTVAKKSGVINLEPEEALEFLREYIKHEVSGTRDWEKELCEEHGVTPYTMAILAGILRRCLTMPQKILTKRLMLTASKLGEKSATFELVLSAIKSGNLQNTQAPLERLNRLAKTDKDLVAMMLLGKVLIARGREKEALEWLRKATQAPDGNLEFDGAGEALVDEGRILLNLDKITEAEAVFRKAALELDEPEAYFHLSNFQEPGSKTQMVYLMKAATAGLVEAWSNLGALELGKIKESGQKPLTIKDFGMAREWCQLAADGGSGWGMLNMAQMLRVVGKMEDGLAWVDKALGVPEVADQAMRMKEQWENDEIKLDDLRQPM